MNDPYMPLEGSRKLTRGALELIAAHRFPVHIITKGDLVIRDLDILREIARVYAAVSFTITTADDGLGRLLEPAAPPPSRRFAAMAELARAGILTGVTMMPVLPFLEDSEENVQAMVEGARQAGAAYLLPYFGVSLRDRQRAYFYAQLDRHFPGVRRKYENRYGELYRCPAPEAPRLLQLCEDLCREAGLAMRIRPYEPEPPGQLSLF
jgi:DNA repair photolyase